MAFNQEIDNLKVENRRLEQCVRLLCKLKIFIEINSYKFKLTLKPNDLQKYSQLVNDIDNNVKNLKTFSSDAEEKTNGKKLIDSDIKQEVNLTLDDNSYDETIYESNESLHSESDDNPKSQRSEVTDLREDDYRIELENDNHEEVDDEDDQVNNICHFCSKKFISQKAFNVHMKTHLMKYLPNDGKDFVCAQNGCDFRSGDQHVFVRHTNEHKKPKRENIDNKLVSEPRVCDLCGKQLSSEHSLQRHNQSFHVTKAFVCRLENCDKRFSTEVAFKRHQYECHLMEKRFVCDHPGCQYRTGMADRLKRHRLNHLDNKPIACTVSGCAKRFVDNNFLRVHLESHKTERIFSCPQEGCHRTYTSQLYVNNHVNKVHREKRIACSWPGCDYKTNSKNTLNIHISFHSSERNFPCDWPGCEMSFKTGHCLAKHKKVHKEDKRHACHWPGCGYRSITAAGLRLHINTHSNEYNFACEWPECGKSFKTKRYLDIHQRIHNNDLRYVCPFPNCHYKTCFQANLKTHSRVHQK